MYSDLSLDDTIKTHEKMVWKLAWKFHKSNWHIDFDELTQIGLTSMIRAYHDYNPIYKTKFITIAYLYCYRDMLQFAKKNRPLISYKEKAKPDGIDEYYPDHLSDKERCVLDMLTYGYNRTEIKDFHNISSEQYSMILKSALKKIRKANSKI